MEGCPTPERRKGGSEFFSGFCGRCGKQGHKQKDCWCKVVGLVEASGESWEEEARDTPWHEGDGGWNARWWSENEAAEYPAPGTLASVTTQVGACDNADNANNSWILTLTKDVMVGGIQRKLST